MFYWRCYNCAKVGDFGDFILKTTIHCDRFQPITEHEKKENRTEICVIYSKSLKTYGNASLTYNTILQYIMVAWDLFLQSLLWHHNGHDGVSNHEHRDCLLNRLFRRRSNRTSKLRVTGLWAGIHRWPVNSSYKWPVTRKMFPSYDVIMYWPLIWWSVVIGGFGVSFVRSLNKLLKKTLEFLVI